MTSDKDKSPTVRARVVAVMRDSEKRYDLIARALIFVFSIVLLAYAFLGNISRAEIESNEFPIVAIQYRGSIFSKPADVRHIRDDFPALYRAAKEIYTLTDETMFQKLPQISDDTWYSFYFPIYPLICMPLKLLFQFLSVDQERCFTVTNALLMLLSLVFVQRRLKVPAKQRLLVVALLMVSPITLNVSYIYYMVFMASFVTMSLVQYYNGRYRSSALLLSIAGMSNATIMAVGLVMIAEYLVKTLRSFLSGPRTWKEAGEHIRQTVLYGLCYVPCLAQYIVNFFAKVPSFLPSKQDTSYLARFMTYLFEPTLGFGTFAPVAILAFFALIVVGLIKRKPRGLIWGAFFLGTVAAFSMMELMNVGMLFCARYLVFTWPIIPLYLATEGYGLIRSSICRDVVHLLLLVSCGVLIFVNAPTACAGPVFNPTTQWLLNHVPQYYNPYYTTFYCRTRYTYDGQIFNGLSYYVDPPTNEIRKLVYKAEEGQAECVMDELTGDDESMVYLEKQLEKHKLDGKYHYINFPCSGKYQVREKTPEEKGEIAEKNVVARSTDVQMGVVDDHLEATLPIALKDETIYKVNINFSDSFMRDYDKSSVIFTDFYGISMPYDNAQQEAYDFMIDGVSDYTFYFDTGDIGTETIDALLRVVWLESPSDASQTSIDSISVTEMERMDVGSTAP